MRGSKTQKRGSSAVELALILPIFFMLLFGTIEGARATWIYTTLAHAAHEGTRYAAVHGTRSDSPATESDIAQVVRDQAVNLDPTRVIVSTTWDPSADPGSVVQVQVQYEFNSLVSLVPLGPLTLSSTSRLVISN